ncbi:SGNH/GDSL hydrolase family protein [Sorangium sp. So ce1014]|uniref:SGNH/GDSL hydrolase family protein n=1 Tax=Sorangium sp. So ce1014 TaxID=3133326 RepID=UPI003F5E1615
MAYDDVQSAADGVEIDTVSIGAGIWHTVPNGVRWLRVVSGSGNLIVRLTGSKGEARTLTDLEVGDVEPLQVTQISGDSHSMKVRLYLSLPPSRERAVTQSLSRAVQQRQKLVFALLGDSIVYGGGPSLDYAMGWRLPFQRVLSENGVRFRNVGRGFGALNGLGATNGRNPNVSDIHDAPAFTPRDVRHNAYPGYRLTQSVAVTNVNTSTGFITAPGNGLVDGEVFAPASTGTIPTFSVVQPLYWVTNVGGAGAGTFQVSQYDGGSTALTILDAGSGSISLSLGLVEMLPAIAQTWDAAPTDIIASGGTNDIIQNINTGVSIADTLALLQEAEIAFEARIDAAAIAAGNPNARKYRPAILGFYPNAAEYEDCNTVAAQFNEWLRDVRLPQLGRLWAYVDVASPLTAAVNIDGVHPTADGYEMMGDRLGRAVVQAVGPGHASDRVPRDFVRRPAQACVELRATTDRITIPTQASLAPGANSFYCAVWYMPFSLPSELNVMLQQEHPYQEGCVIGHNLGRLAVYWKSTGTCIQPAAYTAVMQQYRWHRVFVFFDAVRQEAVLCCNGRYLQRVYTSAAAITSQDGWAVGGISPLTSALGLYQGFLVGHGASLSIEDAEEAAVADYYDGKEPAGMTAKYALSEGTGTVIAGTVIGSTAGTLSGGSWVQSGRYLLPCNHKYVPPRFDSRIANVTTTYTATYGERVPCDPTAGGFTVALPTAVGHDGEQIAFNNMSSSTNTVTLDGNLSETIDGSATIPGLSTARGSRTIEARGGNWITVAAT